MYWVYSCWEIAWTIFRDDYQANSWLSSTAILHQPQPRQLACGNVIKIPSTSVLCGWILIVSTCALQNKCFSFTVLRIWTNLSCARTRHVSITDIFFFMALRSCWARASSLPTLHDYPQSDTPHSVGLLWTSDRPVAGDLCLTTHNTHNRQTSIPSAGFEPAIQASERPQTHWYTRWSRGSALPALHSMNSKWECRGKQKRLGIVGWRYHINDTEPSGYWTHSLIDYTTFLEFILRNMGVRNRYFARYFFLRISLPGGTKNLWFPTQLLMWLN